MRVGFKKGTIEIGEAIARKLGSKACLEHDLVTVHVGSAGNIEGEYRVRSLEEVEMVFRDGTSILCSPEDILGESNQHTSLPT